MTTPTDVVLALYAKLTAGDAPGALALMTDDVEWIPMMDYKVDGRGPQKVLEGILIPAMTEWETFTLTPASSWLRETRLSPSAASAARIGPRASRLTSFTPMSGRCETARSLNFANTSTPLQ